MFIVEISASGLMFGKVLLHKRKRILVRSQPAVQLRVLNRTQNFLEQRAWFITCGNEVSAIQQRLWPDFIRRELRDLLSSEIEHSEAAMARFAVKPVQFEMFIKARQPDKFLKG